MSGTTTSFDGIWHVEDDAHLKTPRLAARISHRLAQHLPLKTVALDGIPRVSFTFDDVPDSALGTGATLLEEHGARGTFYVSGSLLGQKTPDWRVITADGVCELAARGHEIGCHSFGHHRADWIGGNAIVEDVLRNRDLLEGLDSSVKLENFAYPFGYTAFGWKRRFARLFRSCRSIVPGVEAGRVDPQFLRAVPLYDGRLDLYEIARLLDETAARKGWLVFYTHDVAKRPSDYGCSPPLLTYALRHAQACGVAITSVAGTFEQIKS